MAATDKGMILDDETLATIEAGLRSEPDPLNISWYRGIGLRLLEEVRYLRGLKERLQKENETLIRREIDSRAGGRV